MDGMGVSGVEGLFRKSCEKTMEVLRCNSQVIVTILEVLLYDPLYFWTVSSAEANKRQTEEDTYSRSVAEDMDEGCVAKRNARFKIKSLIFVQKTKTCPLNVHFYGCAVN